MKRAQAIYHQAPKSVHVGETDVPEPRSGELMIKTRYSAMSPGPETRLFRGEPLNDGAARGAAGRLQYPQKSGTALVGEVIAVGNADDRDWLGLPVFAYHPHQSHVVLDRRACIRIPEDTPLERALFLANMESALNIVLDINPMIGERVMVFGLGIIGLLTTALLGHYPLAELITADPLPLRRDKSLELGAGLAIDPQDSRAFAALRECLFHGDTVGLDVAVEVSGKINALNQAVQMMGASGRIVIGSRYGRSSDSLDLNDRFLSHRIRLIPSVPNTRETLGDGRWSRDRRLQLAWDWLARLQPEQFITHRYTLSACQEAYELLHARQPQALQVIFRYE